VTSEHKGTAASVGLCAWQPSDGTSRTGRPEMPATMFKEHKRGDSQ
jgi:hypothetical protein